MPNFATPNPLSVDIDLDVGDVKIIASDRSDTVVTVTPTDPDNSISVQAAEGVKVKHSPGALEVKQSVRWGHKIRQTPQPGVVTITIELPAGSNVHGKTSMGAFTSDGRLGECEFTSDYGDLRVGEVTNTLRVMGTAGSIVIERAHADVEAKTTTGSIRIAEVIRGTVVLTTSVGEIEVGVREGSAANLDVRTKLGQVHNSLNGVNDPALYAETVTVRARAMLDDIIVRRA